MIVMRSVLCCCYNTFAMFFFPILSRKANAEKEQQRKVSKGESFEGRKWKSREEIVMRQNIDG